MSDFVKFCECHEYYLTGMHDFTRAYPTHQWLLGDRTYLCINNSY